MKYYFKFLIVFAVLALALPSAKANEVTVCDATTNTEFLPVYGYYFDYAQHNQMIYPQSELSELPSGCFITSLTFYPTGALAFSGADVTFSLTNLEGAAPFQPDAYGNSTALDVSVTPVATVTPSGQTIWTIELEDVFQYTGGDLLIDVTTPGETWGRNYFIAKNLGNNYGFYSYGSTKKAITYVPKLTIAYDTEAKPYSAKVSPTSIDFGKLLPNGQKTENIKLTNKGANAFTPNLSGLGGTPFSTTYTPAEIAPGAEVTIPVTFNPSEVGNYNATLSISASETSEIDLTVTLTGRCANDITVEESTTSQSYLPLYMPGYYTQKNQMIYPAEDLTSLIGKKITGLTFYCDGGLVFDGTYNVALGMTEQTTYSDATPIENLTAVATNHTATAGVDEFVIAFDEPFSYTGGNLVIQMEVTDKGSTGYKNCYFFATNQSNNTSYYKYEASYGTYGYPKAILPMVTFDYDNNGEAPVVTVDAPVFDPENGTTFEENLTVTLTCATAGATIQYSYNGEYFSDYEAPLVIDETTTIFAKAVLGDVESEVVSATYTKEAAPQPSTNEYVLVTDVADLAAGKHIIFVNKENAKAMSSTQNTNNRAATDITISTSDIATATEATEIFTLEKNGDYWLFKASKTPGYIYAAGANSKNYLKTEETADEKAQATVAIASDGEATVTFNITGRNLLKYNSGSNIFSCYASGQLPVFIFMEKTGDTPEPTQVATPTFNPAQGEYTEAQNVTITCATVGATIHYTTDGTEPTAESAVYTEPIAVGETMTIKAIAMKADMTNSEIATATYTINIPQPGEGITFVKVTDAKQLVVGKRYIFVYGNNAMGTAATGNYLSAVSITGGDEVTVGDDDDVAIMTLGGTAAHYTFALGDKYLHAVNSGSLGFGESTEWSIASDSNGANDAGFRAKHANYSRAVKYSSGYNRFGNYSTGDANSEYAWIYVENAQETVPDTVAVPTFNPAAGTYTSIQTVTITCATEDATISYKIGNGEYQAYTEPIRVAESMTITAKAEKTDMITREASAEYIINLPKLDAPVFNPAAGEYTSAQNVTITADNGATIYYTTDGSIPTTESDVYSEPITVAANMTIKAIAVKEGNINSDVAEAAYVIKYPVVAPTFSLVPGSYTEPQTIQIECEDEDATILYSTDGGNTWAEGTSIPADNDVTIMAKATKDGWSDSEIITAFYDIDIPTPLPTMEAFDGYFSTKNLGNDKYANIAGRKTLTFTDNIDKAPGTVIRLVTNDKGQVQVLRSQAADLQGYANRAMKYVPEIVDLVVTKLHAEGDGALLGDEGLDAIMAKFKDCFDYHLYLEKDDNGYRIYGKTPSMQPVVEFYRENKSKVEAKLPMLEDFINDAIKKVLNKTHGSGSSILKPFSLHDTWERMGGTLTEPVDSASTMEFYRQVLNYKDNVWNFAYETAMTYWERIKDHPKYNEVIKPQLGEFAKYIDEIENVHPDFKYYIAQDNNQADFISEGNAAIMNGELRTYWTLEERNDFTVNFSLTEDNESYYTTLYTDFAYTLPEGVTAYMVTGITKSGETKVEALSGTIAAQTPVLLVANEAGDKVLPLSKANLTAPKKNLLVGADYFINEYQLKTKQIETLFNMLKDVINDSTFYNNYVAQYEHLMYLNAGTVNNKYFWALSQKQVEECVYVDDEDTEKCVIRSLSVGNDGIGFYSNWEAPANQAFLSSDTFNPIKLVIRGDVTRDGVWDIDDVTATISIILANAPEGNNYDRDAANFNGDDLIDVDDVTAMIAYILGI